MQQLQDRLKEALIQARQAQDLAEAQAQLLALQAAEAAAASQSLAEESANSPPLATVPLPQIQSASHEQPLEQDEADTRIKIDAQLRAAGWEVHTVELTHASPSHSNARSSWTAWLSTRANLPRRAASRPLTKA